MKNIIIPEGITKIEDRTFSRCYSLTSVDIPSGVTYIGKEAFQSCKNLGNVYCKPINPPILGYNVFEHKASSCKFYVLKTSVDAYKSANGWSDYANDIVGYDFE